MPPHAGRRPAGPWAVSIACLAVAALLVGGVAVVGLTWVRAAITDEVEDSQRLLADERAAQLAASLDQMRDRVHALAGQALFASIVEDRVRLDALLRTASNLPGIAGYTLSDAFGRRLVRIPEDAAGWDAGGDGRATAAADRHDAFVQYAAPVRTADGRRLVLEQLVSIRELLPNWAQRAPSAGTQVTLVRADGEILIHATARDDVRRLSDPEVLRAVAARRSSVVTFDAGGQGEGGRQIAAVRPVGDAGLVVLASQPQADAFAAAQRLTVRLMALLVACSIVLAGLAVVVGRAVQRLRRRIEQERRDAERLAFTDPLTGLANRRGLELAVQDACRRGGEVLVAALDVDGLKEINDELGHGAGDAALHQVGELLRALVRAEDVVARIGGDEFVVLWSATDGHGPVPLETRLRDVLGAFPSVGAGVLGLSVGVAHGDPVDFEHLLRLADERCYADKRDRKGVQV